MSRSTNRLVGTVLGAAVAVAVLTGCDRPTPRVTFQSGATSTLARPQTYCFDVAHCRISTGNTIASLDAHAGSTVLVDVPHEVADNSWSVTAATLGSDNKYTELQVDGASSETITNSHSTRVVVPYANGQYLLIVRESRSGKDSATWVARVTVKN
jgi:hypothetical protein